MSIEESVTLFQSGNSKSILLAAMAGGAISSQWVKGSIWQKLGSIVAGCFVAEVGAEPLSDVLAHGKYIAVCATLIGIFGMSICECGYKMLKEVSAKDLLAMLERLLNKVIDGALSKIPSKGD